MARPWMPLYVADYLADTAHLNAAQSGAYLHLLMHLWRRGELPDDDTQLSIIAKCQIDAWREMRTLIQAFFFAGWRHKRIEKELKKSQDVSDAYAKRAHHAAEARWSKDASSNAPSMNEASKDQSLVMPTSQPQPPSQPQLNNNLLNGKVKAVKKAPFHGAKSKTHVYCLRGTDEFAAYASDYRAAHGKNPNINKHGGKWFRLLGEPVFNKPLEAAE